TVPIAGSMALHFSQNDPRLWTNIPTARERVLKILVVDDEQFIRHWLHRALEMHGFTVVEAESPENAMKKLEDGAVDAIVTDLRLSGRRSGLELLDFVKQSKQRPVPVIMLTGVSALSPDEAEAIRKHRAFVFY